jgi:hypothetical protein
MNRKRLAAVFGLAALLALCGCHGVTYRVAGQANDYAYLFSRAQRACGPAIVAPTPTCHAANAALTDFNTTLKLADAAVQRKGPLKLTEAQLKADRAAALKTIKALEVTP